MNNTKRIPLPQKHLIHLKQIRWYNKNTKKHFYLRNEPNKTKEIIQQLETGKEVTLWTMPNTKMEFELLVQEYRGKEKIVMSSVKKSNEKNGEYTKVRFISS